MYQYIIKVVTSVYIFFLIPVLVAFNVFKKIHVNGFSISFDTSVYDTITWKVVNLSTCPKLGLVYVGLVYFSMWEPQFS